MSGLRQIRIAVIGHTNAGKTSLLRTLARDRIFGEISSRPATTRHVEATTLDFGDGHVLELADTPGLEDSMGLLDALHAADPSPRASGAARIRSFLDGPLAHGEFAQEAKALRQLLASDLALYVVDAREPVLGKYRDEFAILAASGRPCLVVLNFTASPEAETVRWREALHGAGIHNVTAFDTVVYDAADERRLWQQVGLLLPGAEATCARLLAAREAERERQRRQAARLIAEALVDCAALRVAVGTSDADLAARVRRREAALGRDLLALYRFAPDDYAGGELPLASAAWTLDPFDAELLKELGIGLGTSAAKGAAAGALIDALTAFHSLGAATLIGGALGAGVDAVSRLVRLHRDGGVEYAQMDAASARLIARRAVLLVRDLTRRGHAAQTPVAAHTELMAELRTPMSGETDIAQQLARSSRHPSWSGIGDGTDTQGDRDGCIRTLTALLEVALAGVIDGAAEPTERAED